MATCGIVTLARRCALASFLLAAPAVAGAAEFTLLTGNEASSYHRVLGMRFAEVLGPFFDLRLEPTAGGVQNLQLVLTDKSSLGFVQQDVYEEFIATNPDAKSAIEFYPTGQSCVYAVIRRNGTIATYADMLTIAAKRPLVVDVGPRGGETALTHAVLSRLEPALRDARLQHRGGLRAVSHVDMGDTDVALFTLPVVPDDDILRIVLDSESLALMPMASHAFAQPLPDGRKPYTFRQTPVRPAGLIAEEVTYNTVCTGVGIVVNAAGDANLLEAIATIAVGGRLPAAHGMLEAVSAWVRDVAQRARSYLP